MKLLERRPAGLAAHVAGDPSQNIGVHVSRLSHRGPTAERRCGRSAARPSDDGRRFDRHKQRFQIGDRPLGRRGHDALLSLDRDFFGEYSAAVNPAVNAIGDFVVPCSRLVARSPLQVRLTMACKRVPLTAPVWRSLGNAQKPQHSRGIVLCGVAPHIFGCHPRGGLRCGKLGSVMTASAGIHHVTAICSDPKRNVAFYTHNLGLRLVKKTVNFDDPSTWHLYYGDETGQPGTALTFFAWGKVPAGRNGNGMAVETAFIIPERSLGYWTQRLVERGISHEAPEKRFGETVLPLSDPDGMRLALVAVTGADAIPGWSNGDVPAEHAVRGFHGVTLMVGAGASTADVLTGAFGFKADAREGNLQRFI